MPTYDYKCDKCEHVQEEMHRMSETPKIKCAKCGSTKMRKQISSTSEINMSEHPGWDIDETLSSM